MVDNLVNALKPIDRLKRGTKIESHMLDRSPSSLCSVNESVNHSLDPAHSGSHLLSELPQCRFRSSYASHAVSCSRFREIKSLDETWSVVDSRSVMGRSKQPVRESASEAPRPRPTDADIEEI
jgi:hypothetical protein